MVNLALVSIEDNRIGPDGQTNGLPFIIILLLRPLQLLCIGIYFVEDRILILLKVGEANVNLFYKGRILKQTFKPWMKFNPKAFAVLRVRIVDVTK